jgi:hypothetical protein
VRRQYVPHNCTEQHSAVAERCEKQSGIVADQPIMRTKETAPVSDAKWPIWMFEAFASRPDRGRKWAHPVTSEALVRRCWMSAQMLKVQERDRCGLPPADPGATRRTKPSRAIARLILKHECTRLCSRHLVPDRELPGLSRRPRRRRAQRPSPPAGASLRRRSVGLALRRPGGTWGPRDQGDRGSHHRAGRRQPSRGQGGDPGKRDARHASIKQEQRTQEVRS